MKRRRLSDLYTRGREVEVDDGTDRPVTVWLQKLNGVDREACLRRANAAKARFMIEADDEDSEIFQAMYAQIRDMHDRPGLIAIVVAEEVLKYRHRVEAEQMANEKTWGKDGYLQGLMDAWFGDGDNPGLSAVQLEQPDDPEVKRVLGEIQRFEAEVDKLVKSRTRALQKDWMDVPDEDVWRRASHQILERRGNEIFNQEFERQQLFYCVREPDDHDRRYFHTITELDDLDETVVSTLLNQYNEMIVGPLEGKDSRASQPSSISSAPSPEEEEASHSSGREAVNA